MRNVLRDPDYQSHFARHGWVKVPFLSTHEVQSLDRSFSSIASRFGQGWNATILMDDTELRAISAEMIRPVFAPRIREVLQDYTPFSHNFITKGSSEESILKYHTHSSFVDETMGFVTVSVFCPLVDTDLINGNLRVVSGTHRLPRFPRPLQADYDPYKDYWRLFEERSEAVPTKIGEAIIFDNMLIHGSPPNRSPNMRVVASTVANPREAESILYFLDEDGKLSVCPFDEDYLIRNNIMTSRPIEVRERINFSPVDDLGPQIYEVLGLEYLPITLKHT